MSVRSTRKSRGRLGRTMTLVASLGIIAPLALTACGGSEEGGSDVVTLTLWDTDARTERTERIQHLIALFEASHESIKIEYVGMPTDSYMEKNENAIATHTTSELLISKAKDPSTPTKTGA